MSQKTRNKHLLNVNDRKRFKVFKVIRVNHVKAEHYDNYLISSMQSQTEQYLDRKHLYKSPCTSSVVVIIKWPISLTNLT